MAEPPFVAGAMKATDAWALPLVATAPVGAPGVVEGTTAADAALAAPFPLVLVATTVNV